MFLDSRDYTWKVGKMALKESIGRYHAYEVTMTVPEEMVHLLGTVWGMD